MKPDKPTDRDSRLDYVEYEELGNPTRYPKSRYNKWVLTIFVSLALLLVAAINTGVWLWALRGPREALDESWNYCGRTSQEAIRRGCVMEPLFYGWMPPQCVYQNLTERYRVFEDRKWFLEQNMTTPVSPEELWLGEHVKAYTHIYHNQHCLFQWRKIMFSLENNLPYIDNKTISIHHTSHCADQIVAEGAEVENAVNEVELGFYRCRNTPWGK